MKIWHISDTHMHHDLLTIPTGIDMVIHSGDCSNPRDPYTNEPEVRNFIHWYKSLPIEHKIYVAGNHDTSIEKRLVTKIDFSGYNIHYLENDYIDIDGVAIACDVSLPFGRGIDGALDLKVTKDRPGYVRALCPDAKTLGVANIRNGKDGSISVSISGGTVAIASIFLR